MTPEEQAALSAQDPAPQPVTPPAAAAPPVQPGPWDADLNLLFTDPAVRGQVDQYLRTKIQPRMTQLEQSAAASAQAQTLMDDLVSDPHGTMAALAAETGWSPQEVQEAVQEFTQEPAPVDPRLEAMWAEKEMRDAEASYESEMAQQVALHPGLEPALFHPFVGAADGNFTDAYTMYTNWVEQFNSTHGAPADPAVPAPPTLGGDLGATTPPTVPAVAPSLGDAIKSFMNDNALTNDPPPIS